MKVSIIIPVYNVEPYVERCLRSVMGQTYGNIECIIVDDCTPDGSAAICERMIAEYYGPIEFRLLRHERNRGLSAARNTGTDAATGEYVYYLDSDDEITSDCIALMVAEAERHPGVEMVTAAVRTVPHKEWFDLLCYGEYKYVDNQLWTAYMLNKQQPGFPVCAWNKLVRRDFLNNNGIEFKAGLIHEDELWTHLTTMRLSAVAILPQRTYIHYTDVEGSIMQATRERVHAEHYTAVVVEIIKSIGDAPLGMLAFWRVYSWLLRWYIYLPKRDYQEARRAACRYLLHRHEYLMALRTHFFFKWNLALGLRKWQPQLERYVEGRYRREEERAAKLVEGWVSTSV